MEPDNLLLIATPYFGASILKVKVQFLVYYTTELLTMWIFNTTEHNIRG